MANLEEEQGVILMSWPTFLPHRISENRTETLQMKRCFLWVVAEYNIIIF